MISIMKCLIAPEGVKDRSSTYNSHYWNYFESKQITEIHH